MSACDFVCMATCAAATHVAMHGAACSSRSQSCSECANQARSPLRVRGGCVCKCDALLLHTPLVVPPPGTTQRTRRSRKTRLQKRPLCVPAKYLAAGATPAAIRAGVCWMLRSMHLAAAAAARGWQRRLVARRRARLRRSRLRHGSPRRVQIACRKRVAWSVRDMGNERSKDVRVRVWV